ncbi:MAG: hypothetical protein DMD91_13780 [Candidatus Rokuibacteriota bacterium]|nr:MAG: hypothetical protein DMD91_13780 [Candidatus Rokubacteria bacterium]
MSGGRPSILYVIDNLEFGGGERGFVQLAAALHTRYRVAFACAPGGVLAERLPALGVRIHPIPFRRQISLKRLRDLAVVIRSERVDLVHSMGARADVAARLAARLAGVPVVSTIAMFAERFDVGRLRRFVYHLLSRATERMCAGLIAESDAIRTTLVREHGLPAARVVRIYRGVELDDRPSAEATEYLRASLGLPVRAPVVGTVGRLVYQKAQDVFLRAAALVVQEIPDARFLVVGEGPQAAALERLRSQLGLDAACRFTGFRRDVAALLGVMDVFTLPSILEGFPQVLLEAFAQSRPVVATRIDGVTELIEDHLNGRLVPSGDAAALAATLIELLQDRAQAGKLGQAGRRHAEEQFSVTRMVQDVETFYDNVLHGAERHAG